MSKFGPANLQSSAQEPEDPLVCNWPSCHSRESVELVRADADGEPVPVCETHRKAVLGVSS